MSDGKSDGPYLNRVEPAPCFDFYVSYAVGPSVKVNAENIGVEHLNAAWHSRDAEVDALKERVKELELELAQSVPCEWEGACLAAQEDRAALRKENERLRHLLKMCQPQLHCVCEDEQKCHGCIGYHLIKEVGSALAQPQGTQEVKP